MHTSMRFEPLCPSHLDELSTVLLDSLVYEHIDNVLPTREEFVLGLQRAIAGPGPLVSGEMWLNFLVRDPAGAMVGRLEATVHHGLAEVAFLLGPRYWGRGWASQGLQWLQGEVLRSTGVTDLWATTAPANIRSQRLLQRRGYVLAQPPSYPLYSFDPGDLVYRSYSAA